MEKKQECVADLQKAELEARPQFEKAVAIFNESTKDYKDIEDRLYAATKAVLLHFCQTFADIQDRINTSPALNGYKVPEVALNEDKLKYVDQPFMDDVDDVDDVTSTKTYFGEPGFSYFSLLYVGDHEDEDRMLYVVIPRKYLESDGVQLMNEDAARIAKELDQVEARYNASYTQAVKHPVKF